MSTPGGTARYVGEAWLGFVAVAAASVGLVLGFTTPADPGVARLGVVLGNGAAPALLVIVLALIGVRTRLVPLVRAVAAAMLGVTACGLGVLAIASWRVGFELADVGRPATLFASLFLGFLGASWLLGAVAVFLPLVAVLRRTALSPTRRGFLAALVAAFIPPVLGLSFLSPGGPVVASIGVTVLVLVAGARRGSPGGARSTDIAPASPAADAGSLPAGPVPAGRLSVGRVPGALAWLSAGLGAGALAFALTGSAWPEPLDSGLNGTSAMGWGISAGLVAALPLLLAVALVLAPRRPRHTPAWSVWGPAALVGGALLAAAAFSADNALTDGAGSLRGWNLAALSLLLYGVAIALVAFVRLPLRGAARVFAAALIGFGVTVVTGAGILVVPFALPLAAVLLATVGIPRINRPRPARGPAGPAAPGIP